MSSEREFERLNLLQRDQLGQTTEHFLNLSSANRDKAIDPSSNDVTYIIPIGIKDSLSIEVEQFEIPHTRYAINSSNNTMYISEFVNGVYNFFALKAGTGGYTVTNLAIALELSTASPCAFTENAVLTNTYSFTSSESIGKIAIISSGDVPYNIHNCRENLKIVRYTKISDTEATVTFIAPYDYILAAGALLNLNVFEFVDRQVQVIDVTAPRTVTLIGDFTELDDSVVSLSKTYLEPYSAINSMSDVIGLGLVDLQTADSKFNILAFGSPFATEVIDGVAAPTILTEFSPFLSLDDIAVITGSNAWFANEPLTVVATSDENHLSLGIEVAGLWSSTGTITITNENLAETIDVSAIDYLSSAANVVTLTVTPDSGVTPATWAVGEIVTLGNLTHGELANTEITIESVDTGTFVITFIYNTSVILTPGSTFISPSNETSGLSTTYIAPNRYDLSINRRVLLVRCTVDGVDIGNVSIPGNPTIFFSRIQLLAGADLVNFTNDKAVIGKYRFPGRVKNLRTIRLRFYEETGLQYDFLETEFSLFLKVTSALGFVA